MRNDLYKELTQPAYQRSNDYYTEDLGEGMSLVHESIYGWWKPRFLLDHRKQEAFEFLDRNEHFVQFSEKDVDLKSVRNVSSDAYARAKAGNATFPTHIGRYHGNIARVSWQINPDGMYYMDEDGYGMTDDEEITLYGAIDRTGRVVKKYHK